MSTDTVVVFGAGATKACGGPLTAEILPRAFAPNVRNAIQRQDYMKILDDFLVQNFHVPHSAANRKRSDYPALPLLLSLIDTAIDRNQPIANWSADRLIKVRQSLEYVIFALLDLRLRRTARNCYLELLKRLYLKSEPIVISLNYDLIADNAIIKLSQRLFQEGRFPAYGCEIKTSTYRNPAQYFGRLFKLHGSLNWMYCPGCHRLDIGVSKSDRLMVKVLGRLYAENPSLEARYSKSHCRECKTLVRPVLITPTHHKDYRNPHVAQVWYQAERALREAKRIIFVGYSLPDDDVDVVYLFKRGLINTPTKNITVIEKDKERRSLKRHPVGARYRSLFGDQITWWNTGLESYIKTLGGS
jgi:hypothetical protein